MTGKLSALAPTPMLPSDPLQGLVRRPGQLLCPEGLIFTGVETFIRRHLAKLIGEKWRKSAERYALLDGPPGTGKTYAATDASLRAGFTVVNIPGAKLAGATENAATEALAMLMQAAEAHAHAHGERVAVVIDDFHLGIAGSDDSKLTKTVNSHLLTGEFQRMADRPQPYVSPCGTVIPIIFTGNDFSTTTPSLFRDMRANRYTHIPTLEEKLHIIFHMLSPRSRDELHLLEKVVRTYKRQPIAYWAALRNDLLATHLDQALSEGPLRKDAIDAAWPKRPPLDPDLVWRFAKARATHTLVNHY